MTDLLDRARAVRWGGPDGGHPPTSRTVASSAPSHDRLWMGEVGDTFVRAENPAVQVPRVRAVPTKSPVRPLHPFLTGLVQQLFMAAGGSGRAVRSVVFASVEGVGESGLVSAAVAEILSGGVSGAISLVDANFQAPSLHRYYGVPNSVGLADALATAEPIGKYAQQLASGHKASLWFFPSGTPAGDGERLLMAEPSQGRIRGLLETFDYVVIDAPAVPQYRGACLLAPHVDGVVLVAEANVTRRLAVGAAADMLRASGARVLGTVLNNRTFPIPKALYEQL